MTPRSVLNTIGLLISGGLILAANPAVGASTPFDTLNGTWAGGGNLHMIAGLRISLNASDITRAPVEATI